jgi:hypothetical protein
MLILLSTLAVKHSVIMSYENPEDIPASGEGCYCPKDCDEILYQPKVSYDYMDFVDNRSAVAGRKQTHLEPILRFLNLQLQRQRCSRLERFTNQN